jgi:hypothetical protein
MNEQIQNKIQEILFPIKKFPAKRKIIFGLIGLLIIGGLFFANSIKSKTSTPKLSVNTVKNEPILDFIANYKEEDISLSQVPNFQVVKEKYGLKLSANQEKYLDKNKFLLVNLDDTSYTSGYNFDQMLRDFNYISGSSSIYYRKPEDTKLITPDIVLHAYHKYFELTLEELEQKELSQHLNDFLTSLHQNLATAVNNNSGYLKERYQNLEAQIVLARVLFENKNPVKPDYFDDPSKEKAFNTQDATIDSVSNAKNILTKYSSDLTPQLITNVSVDLDKIYIADTIGASPLFLQYNDNLSTDYTQFIPRGHYTKNSALRAYFRTMMYLGRSSYFLKKDVGVIDSNLLVKQFSVKNNNGIIPLDSWSKIMNITGFYAGQSDDITYNEWQNYKSQILGSNFISDNDLSSSDNIQKLVKNLTQLRMPKILSDVIVDPNIFSKTKADLLRDTLSFRVFGQRFTFDAWILNNLTAGQEKTETLLPSTPSALFIPAAFGDLQAKQYSGDYLSKDGGISKNDVTGFLTKLDDQKSKISKVTKDEWFTSMGSAWLYVLGSLTHNYGENYPKYMQAVSFLDKQIQTFLGSYTELKHDTLLYAKQSYAEFGGGGGEETIPPVVKGFVEPNMVFWNRFNELLDRTEQFFVKNDLLKDRTPLARLQEFKKISIFYSDLAKKELQGQPISDDEYEKLRTTNLSFMAEPFNADAPDENSSKVALIADIHTDALKGKILYEATGKPYLMLAVVSNEQTPRIVASLVYNHYEFIDNLEKRLTDENWRKSVYGKTNKLPPKNFWYQSLLVK